MGGPEATVLSPDELGAVPSRDKLVTRQCNPVLEADLVERLQAQRSVTLAREFIAGRIDSIYTRCTKGGWCRRGPKGAHAPASVAGCPLA